MKVTKRDGTVQEFDKQKIRDAVLKAFTQVDSRATDADKAKASEIARAIEKLDRDMDVEEIQDLVEKKLMDSARKDVAKAYIIYRNDRNLAREYSTDFMKQIAEKLDASDVQNQNANVDEKSFGGRRGEADGVLLSKYALDKCMKKRTRNNHLHNEVYCHDLRDWALGDHNCLTVPFDKLLANGFNTRQTDVRPAQSVNTAMQLVAVIFQLQSLQQFGGVSASHLDWTMVPYVRKSFMKHYITEYIKQTPAFVGLDLFGMLFDEYDEKIENGMVVVRNRFDDWVDENKAEAFERLKLKASDFTFDNKKLDPQIRQSALFDTIVETQQAVEGLYHNLNTLQSRSGNQLPFTSINYGTCTLPEGRLITKTILSASLKGVGKLHKTPIFPCGIFQCMKGVNRKPGEPNYDLFKLAIKSTAKRLYPNYANVDWSVNAGYDRDDPKTYVSTMGLVTTTIAHLKPFEPCLKGVA